MSYIYIELTQETLARELLADEYAGWTNQGAYALAEYLIELAESTDEPIKFDRVAIRCEFNEFADIDDYNSQYGTSYESYADIEQLACPIDDISFICYEH